MTGTFTGWLREPGGAWHQVCSTPTEREAWGALLRVASTAPTCERTLTRGGRRPDDGRKPK